MLSIEETAALVQQDRISGYDALKIVNDGQDECGPFSAAGLLEEKMGEGIRRRFRNIDKKLIELLCDVRAVFPDAEFYTASGGFTLMIGPSHNDWATSGNQELVAYSGKASIGDGDF